MESNITASKSFSWANVNWDALRRLRARFLQFDGKNAGGADYWRSHSELESYDFTFAERIGWKWDTVLAELRSRGWTLPGGTVWDYGCGTGIAGRRVVDWAGTQAGSLCHSPLGPTLVPQGPGVLTLLLSDRSKPALHFALERARQAFRNLTVEIAKPDSVADVLVVSHVLNELTPEALEQLLAVAQRAQALLWVEPGTAAVSRALIGVRERLLPHFHPVAPCTHALRCGMLATGNEQHWCHHFAKVPGAVFQDGGWGRFAKTLEIDIRSVPFSYLILDRRPVPESTASRVIGEPRYYKGFAKVLSCQADGVRELVLQKRDAPELLKAMKKDPGSLYQWELDGDKIRTGTRIF